MKKQIIAVDIDDVLADSARGFIEFSNRHFGTTLAVENYGEHLMKMWGVDLAEQERRVGMFFDKEGFAQYEHDNTALPVLKRLRQKYDLIIVTSRRTVSKKLTSIWLAKKFPGIFPDETVYFTGFHDEASENSVFLTKGGMLKSLGVDYMIDDQSKHCLSAAELGIEALLFGNYKWNCDETLPGGVTRVKGWVEVEKYFNETA